MCIYIYKWLKKNEYNFIIVVLFMSKHWNIETVLSRDQIRKNYKKNPQNNIPEMSLKIQE